jgi:hypothetical protein
MHYTTKQHKGGKIKENLWQWKIEEHKNVKHFMMEYQMNTKTMMLNMIAAFFCHFKSLNPNKLECFELCP